MKHKYLLWISAIPLLYLGVSSVRAAGLDVERNLMARSPLREVHDEADPSYQQSCDSMGHIGITYETENAGPPNIGLRITDPRGRKIGYDPRVPKVWEELPIAEGFVECEVGERWPRTLCSSHTDLRSGQRHL